MERRLAILSVLLVFSLVLALVPVRQAQAAANPAFSTGDTQAFLNYLKSFYQTVYRPDTGAVILKGYRCNPVYNITGGDYFNYWTDDHGKILLVASLLGDMDVASRAYAFIKQNSIETPSGRYLFGRIANSSLYSSSPIGESATPAENNYYLTNRILAFINASDWQSPKTNVFEKALSVANVWDALSNNVPPDLNAGPFVVAISPMMVYWSNSSAPGLTRQAIVGPSTPQNVTLYYYSGLRDSSGQVVIPPYYRVRRLVGLWDPRGLVPTGAIKVEVNATMVPWRQYTTITLRVINHWTDNIYVSNATLAFASIDNFLYREYPYFYWEHRSNGVVEGPILPQRGGDQTLWDGTGSAPDKILFAGFSWPAGIVEATKGWLATIDSARYGLARIDWTSYMGDSVNVWAKANFTMPVTPNGASPVLISASLTPMQKTSYYMASALFGIDEQALPDGTVMEMSASTGLVALGLAEYYLRTNRPDVLELTKGVWAFLYNDARQRLSPPSWIPQSASERITGAYYRSTLTHAIAGLLLDPKDTTYRGWAREVTEKLIYRFIDTDSSSAIYGGFTNDQVDAEEYGYAYALLMLQYRLYGDKRAHDIANGLLNGLKVNSGYTDETPPRTWPLVSSSPIRFLPSVYLTLRNGTAFNWINIASQVWRLGEMNIGLMLGAMFDGSGDEVAYDEPQALAAVDLVWKAQASQGPDEFSVYAGYNWDTTFSSNTETQPAGMMALALWKAHMWNMTRTVYVNRVYRASLASVYYSTTDATLYLVLNSVSSLTGATVSLYYPYSYQILNMPTLRVEFSNGTIIGDAVSFYSQTTRMLTLGLTFPAGGQLTIIIRQIQVPVGLVVALASAVTAAIIAIILVRRKKMKREHGR